MLMIWLVQSWAEIDSEQRMLLTMKVWGLERVADVATVAEFTRRLLSP